MSRDLTTEASPWVQQVTEVAGLSETQLDQLFDLAASL